MSKKYDLMYTEGQDVMIDKMINSLEHYPHIQLERATRKIVHIAFDQSLPQHILWFTNGWVTDKMAIPGGPTYSYNVGMLKDTGNFTYTRMPENQEGIVALALYTRMFQSIHKNVDG